VEAGEPRTQGQNQQPVDLSRSMSMPPDRRALEAAFESAVVARDRSSIMTNRLHRAVYYIILHGKQSVDHHCPPGWSHCMRFSFDVCRPPSRRTDLRCRVAAVRPLLVLQLEIFGRINSRFHADVFSPESHSQPAARGTKSPAVAVPSPHVRFLSPSNAEYICEMHILI
jgi:hypothetical protein